MLEGTISPIGVKNPLITSLRYESVESEMSATIDDIDGEPVINGSTIR